MSSSIADEESARKGIYGRVALTEQEDWMDDPSEEGEDEVGRDARENGDNGVLWGGAGGQDNDQADGRYDDGIIRRPSPDDNASSSDSHSLWNARLLPDDCFSIGGVALVDGAPAVKLLKFLAITFGGICVMYKVVRFMDWENKRSFTLEKFRTYESTQVVSDTIVFFVVARLWKQRGVDQISWLFWLTFSNIFMSTLPDFKFLQQSFTLYSMHCTWSWKLWAFVGTIAPLVIFDILLHVHYAVRHGFFVRKLLELVMAVVFWFMPHVTSPYFHLHHWFAGWWIGMHANFDTWWSRATLAWCWGLYINGIAAYGRDPVLTCGYALFVSQQNRCPFLDCYTQGIHTPKPGTNATVPMVQPMVQPDWRNCSADSYHP